MSTISINEFDAQWKSTDSNGKIEWIDCTVVGLKDGDTFIAIYESEDGNMYVSEFDSVRKPPVRYPGRPSA